MSNTIAVQTAQGISNMPVMHKNRALQVVQVPTKLEGVVFYNTTHDNGLRLPNTDTDVLEDAILICNWCVENFPEFAKTDLDVSKISTFRANEFKRELEKFRVMDLRDWERDYE